MTLIRCTQKLRKEMGLGPTDLSNESQESLLGDWYAHPFFYDRKKCLLFTVEKTLLTFLVTAVTRDLIRKLDDVFREGLFRLLLDEGFQPVQVNPLFDSCRLIEYAATTDRSTTGSMNELVKDAQFWLGQYGGPTTNLTVLNQKLNRIPMKRIEYANAIEATKILLDL